MNNNDGSAFAEPLLLSAINVYKNPAAFYFAAGFLYVLLSVRLCLADIINLCGSFGDLVTEFLYCSNVGFDLAYCGCYFLVDCGN